MHLVIKYLTFCGNRFYTEHLRDCRKTLNAQIWYLQAVVFITCENARISIFGLFRQFLNISPLNLKLDNKDLFQIIIAS